MEGNKKAFLDMIADSELGKELLAVSDNGYNVIVGSTPSHPILFDSYADHPRQSIWLEHLQQNSTAAGRYQILARFYDAYKKILKLPDFSPPSQDAIAIQYARECHALDDIDNGRIADAIVKCKSRWASFPGADYANQHMNKMNDLITAYENAGGTFA